MADSSRSETSGQIDKSAADATSDGHDRVSHKSAISNHNPKAPNVTIDLGGLLSHGEPAGHSSAKSAEPEVIESAEEGTETPDRPKGIRFVIVYSCILLGDFFVGYDTSCVTTLTPLISDEFKAIDHVGWYGIAYILALASSVLTFGRRDPDKLRTKKIDNIISAVDISGDIALASLAEQDRNHDMG